MEYLCPFCNKTYANKRSLASHKSQFHKTLDNNRKVLLPNPISEDTIPAYGEDINRKRFYSSEESEDENEVIVKIKK